MGHDRGRPLAAAASTLDLALALALGLAALAGSAGCAPPRHRGDVATLYRDSCARCHGSDGRGDPRTRGLTPGLDLTRAPLVRAGDREEVRRRIARGFGPMPGFARKLDAADIERLTDYTLTFAEE